MRIQDTTKFIIGFGIINTIIMLIGLFTSDIESILHASKIYFGGGIAGLCFILLTEDALYTNQVK